MRSSRSKKQLFTYFFICLWLALLLVSPTFGQQSSESNSRKRRISEQNFSLSEKSKIAEAKLLAGQKHSYEFKVNQGEYLHLTVIKKDIDIIASLFDPNNKKLIEVASTDRPQDLEVGIFLLVEISGKYQLHIVASNPSDIGSYGIKIKELRTATKEDKDRITLQSAYGEAERLRLENTKESLQKALSIYTSILPKWKQVGDVEGEGATLNAISAIYYTFGQYPESLQNFEQSLKIWQQINNPLWEVATLNAIGTVCSAMKENRRALYYYLKAQQIATKLKDPQWLILSLNGLGKTCTDLGEYQQALNYYQQVRTLKKPLGDRRGEAIALSNIGNIYTALQDQESALNYHKEALEIFNAIGDTGGEASTYNNLGRSYMLLGNYSDALEQFQKALEKKHAIFDLRGEATTFNNIGYLYIVRSEQNNNNYFLNFTYFGRTYKLKALEQFKQALPIWQKLNDPQEEQTSLSLIAKTFKSLGDDKSASEVSQQISALDKYIEKVKNTSPNGLDNSPNNILPTEQISTNSIPANNTSNINSTSTQNSQSVLVQIPKVQSLPASEIPYVSKRKTATGKPNKPNSSTPESENLEKTALNETNKVNKTTIPTNNNEKPVSSPTATSKQANQKDLTESINEKLSTGKGNYSIQVGALSKREEAESLSSRLRSSGLSSYIAEGNAGGKIVFRVRMGRFASIEEAKKVAAQLKAKGAIRNYFIATQ